MLVSRTLAVVIGVGGLLLGAGAVWLADHRETHALLEKPMGHRPLGKLVWTPKSRGLPELSVTLAANYGSEPEKASMVFEGTLSAPSGERVLFYYPAQTSTHFRDILLVRFEGGSEKPTDFILENGSFRTLLQNKLGILCYRAE